MKRNEILTYARTQMNLENFMLSARSQTHKATHCVVPFMWISEISKSIETESILWFPGTVGRRGWGVTAQCMQGFDLEQHYKCTYCHWIVPFKMVNLCNMYFSTIKKGRERSEVLTHPLCSLKSSIATSEGSGSTDVVNTSSGAQLPGSESCSS